jgi:two-component system phosphate regulon sensor histidine kinase PhoR
MRASHIRTITIAGTLALAGIVALQFFWVRNNEQIHERELRRQARQQQLLEDEFNDRVKVSLSNVARQILQIYNDPAEIYKAVEQISSNYYVVRINDTLNPYLLENLLLREFQKNSINEDFQYGIYDCFTDSIVYGNYMRADSLVSATDYALPPQIKWNNNEGHYFSVRFPARDTLSIQSPLILPNAWLIASAAVLLALLFFTYAILVIMRQKKIGEMRNDFISNMTHELKTPISTISLSGEMLQRDDVQHDPEKIRRYAGIILNENKRLERQVERVLQISKLEKGTIALNPTRFDVHALIDECRENFGLSLRETNGTITADLQATSSTVWADRVHVHNMLNNLIDNAIKYSPNGPQITLRTWNQNNQLCVSVADKGIGIPAQQQRRIFEKFYRAETGNVHNVKGYGLGLYYVKLLVHAHNGSISLNSREGEGSEFILTLPLNNGR